MKIFFVLFILILCFFLFTPILKSEENTKIIRGGEQFSYSVKWRGIPVASSEIIVLETTNVNEQPAYHVINKVWTAGVVKLFFKVENVVETFMDANSLLPWRYLKKIKEGRYRDTLTVNFDQNNHLAIREDTSFVIPNNVQDPLSILWYFKKQIVKEGDIVNIAYCDGKKNEIIRINVLKKEKVTTPLGEFIADVIEFSVGEKDRKYLGKEVRLKIWFSDDEMRMPVLIQARAPVGLVTAFLTGYSKPQ